MKEYIIDYKLDSNSECIKELVKIVDKLLLTLDEYKMKNNISYEYVLNDKVIIPQLKMNEFAIDYIMSYVIFEKL